MSPSNSISDRHDALLCGCYLLLWMTARGLQFTKIKHRECVRPQRMLTDLAVSDKPLLGPLQVSPDPTSHPSTLRLHLSALLAWSMLQECCFSALLLFSCVALFPVLSLARLLAGPGWTWFSPYLQAQCHKLFCGLFCLFVWRVGGLSSVPLHSDVFKTLEIFLVSSQRF